MAVANRILKNFNLYVDGRGCAGNIEDFTPPSLGLVGEDFRAGGMDAPIFIELGQEKMEAKFNLTAYDENILALWGVGPGNSKTLIARGALVNLDGSVVPIKITMGCDIKQVEPAAWKGGEKSALAFTVALRTYKYEQNGNTIHDIDIPNMTRVINGTDTLADQRDALGIS